MKRSTGKFEVVEQKIVPDRCVVLDVATATELPQLSLGQPFDGRGCGARTSW